MNKKQDLPSHSMSAIVQPGMKAKEPTLRDRRSLAPGRILLSTDIYVFFRFMALWNKRPIELPTAAITSLFRQAMFLYSGRSGRARRAPVLV